MEKNGRKHLFTVMKPTVAIVRGKFLNRYEMQFYEALPKRFSLTAFASLTPFHDQFSFPVVKLPSPMDLPDVPYKMQVLNRLFIDAHYLLGLEQKLKGFDMVHTAETYYHYTQQALNAKRKGYVKKVIATVLENIPFNNEGIWGRKKFKARAREELDHIIALTHLTRDALIAEGADRDKITVLPHFVDTKRFAPKSDWFTRIADPNKRKFTILFSGRLEKYKGVYDVLDAAEYLKRDRDLVDYNLRFLFVGDGSEKLGLLKKEKQLGLNYHSRHVSAKYIEMPSWYRLADIVVAPSKPTRNWQEQYCTALLEAQSMGLPIVTTRTGGIHENVGDAAVLVAPGNSHELYTSLKTFILDAKIRAVYARRARERAQNVHDIAHGARLLSEIYDRILAS